MPPSVKPKFSQLKIHFFKGEHLPKLDTRLLREGKMDAYLKTEIGNKKLKTQIVETVKDEAYWNETMMVPLKLPVMSSGLKVRLLDYDTTGDEVAGCINFDYKQILAQPPGEVKIYWINVYGAPGGDKIALAGRPPEYDEMNNNPEIATCWKGRVLVGVEHEETDSPKCQVVKITDSDLIELAQDWMQPTPFQVMVMAGSVICTPHPSTKYTLKVKVAEHEWQCKDAFVGVNFHRWNDKSSQMEWMMPYKELSKVGWVFVYLMYGNEPISYAKFPAEEFMHASPKLKWVEFTVDPVI